MNETALLHNYLTLGAILFGLGLIGFTVRRNIIVMFLCAELMLQGVSLNLVAWGRHHNDWGGQALVVFIITIAACEAVIALVLILCRVIVLLECPGFLPKFVLRSLPLVP